MNRPEIVTTPQDVTVEGIRIPRPSRISVLQWMEFWDSAKEYDEDYIEKQLELLQLQRWARLY